ncbi:MNIO family bufferin maturase [Sphingomonas faeni]|uniref:MNIO family bufferin maturase n=1 Tax=Sphingomonas faeni TaxID=185950 RepID=UPI0033649BE5
MTITAGIGFKTMHLEQALATDTDGLWFEVHAENYMVDGGPRLAALVALADRHPISLHGVGLSLASVERPSPEHLMRLRRLIDLIRPIAVSDHLAWQRWNGAHHSDFLPFPRTLDALSHAADNVDIVQAALGRAIMVENPSLYIDLPGHEMSEIDFLTELSRRTGCGLLLDVNNVFVSASNLGFSPEAAIDAYPGDLVGEIHLAGHSLDADPDSALLIDSHGCAVADPVWALYDRLIARIGACPTLIERDDDIPDFATLIAERNRAHHMLAGREMANV